jgi:hypothetical protein
VTIVDGADAPSGSFRLRRRSVVAENALGVTIGRATALPDQIVVRHRDGRVAYVFRIEDSGSIPIEDGAGSRLGRLEIEADRRVVLLGPDGYHLGEAVTAATEEGEIAEVYGASGTDRLFRVANSDELEISMTAADGTVTARWRGPGLSPLTVAASGIDPPGAHDASESSLFQAGMLLLFRRTETRADEQE